MRRYIFIIFLFSLFVVNAEGGAVPSPFVYGIRPLGMGGAFTAVADDYNLLMYNPAGLANIKKWYFTLLQLDIGTNSKTLDMISWLSSNSSRLSNSDLSTWTQSDINKLGNAGIKLNVNSNILTFVGRHFGFGGFAKISADVAFETGIFIPKANIDVSADAIAPISYGQYISGFDDFFKENLGGGRLAVGGTFKIVNRRGLKETRTALELTSISPDSYVNKIQESKTGIGFDLGFLFDTSEEIYSTFGLVVNDVYTSIGGDIPKPNLRIGAALRPPFDIVVLSNPTIALDINGINNSDLTFFNKIHIGAEIDFIKWISVRGGFYQGYPSYGLGIPLGFIRFEFASYGVELGKYPGQIEERNYLGTLAMRF